MYHVNVNVSFMTENVIQIFDIEIEKHKFYNYRSPSFLEDVILKTY